MDCMLTLIQEWFTIPAVAAVVLFIASVNYLYRRPRNFPPGPTGLPFVGILPFLEQSPEENFLKWSKKWGPIISVSMAMEDTVVLNDYESITQALVKEKELVSGRPSLDMFKTFSDETNGLISVDYTPAYKAHRKFCLANFRQFGIGKKSMETCVIEEISYLNQSIKNQEGRPFHIAATLRNAVSNNICSVVFGQRFDYSDPIFARLMHLLLNSVNDPDVARKLAYARFANWLRYIPPFSTAVWQLRKENSEMCDIMRGIINEHKKTLLKENPRDIVDEYLISMKGDGAEYFSDNGLVEFCRDLFMGGTETTTSTIRWAIIFMLHNPETQKKLRKEIVNVLGHDGIASMSDKTNMPYTNAFIDELQRMRPLLPLGVVHKTNGKVKLGGYDIQKDTTVLANLWGVQNDSDLWKNPEKFHPERHLDENGNFVKSKYMIPFGLGGRRCVGETLAKVEVFLFLVSMVQKFHFRAPPDGLPSLYDRSNVGVIIPAPFKVIADEL